MRPSSFSSIRRPTALPRAAAALLAAALLAPPASGQSAAFQFSFSNPGARSLGFGGAFVALADDATAAFANPAGLVQLLEPELSIEGRSWSYSVPYFSGGRLGGRPTGIGLDVERGIRSARSETEHDGLSFLSFVYPGSRGALALYRHQLASFTFGSETQGVFSNGLGGTSRRPDVRVTTDLEITTQGVAVALRLSDRLSLGLGLSHFAGKMRFAQEDYLWDADTPQAFYGPNSFLPGRRVRSSAATVDDEGWGLTAGLLWRCSDERWSVGGFYRQGPELETEVVAAFGPADAAAAPTLQGTLPLAFPRVFGMGLAFRSAGGRLTASFEWDWVEYSTLIDSARSGFARLGEGLTLTGVIGDAFEAHLGAEFLFLKSTPLLAVRGGVWIEPDHLVRTSPAIDLGSDEVHLALGLGAAFERFQIDLGADFSQLLDTVSMSAIFSF